MAESKRTFQAAKIERDLDERLIQPGSYRDALNVSVASSEDANTGAAENIKGNNLIDNLHADITQDILGLSSSNTNATVVGTCPHPEDNKIYYFIKGDKYDGIFEYDVDNNKVNTIVIEGIEGTSSPSEGNEVYTDKKPEFKFATAFVVAAVKVNGVIKLSAQEGILKSLTNNFGEYVSTDTVRDIEVEVLVPSGYSNSNDYVYGTVKATQKAVGDAEIFIDEETKSTTTSTTLNAHFNVNKNLTEVGFYYTENTGGSETYEYFANKFEIFENKIIAKTAILGTGTVNTFSDVSGSDITVTDGSGAVITQANNWEYTQGVAGAHSQWKWLNESILDNGYPITVGQTSTKTQITNGLTAASIVSNGTQVTVEDTAADIVSPFSTNVTSLTEGTSYIAVAYATNAAGTQYSNVLPFKTATPESLVTTQISDKLIVTPTVDDTATQGQYHPGYGDFIKGDGNYYFAFSPMGADGKYEGTSDLTGKITLSNTGPSTLTYTDLDASFAGLPAALTGSRMSGSFSTSPFRAQGISVGSKLAEPSSIYKNFYLVFDEKDGTEATEFLTQLGIISSGTWSSNVTSSGILFTPKTIRIEWADGSYYAFRTRRVTGVSIGGSNSITINFGVLTSGANDAPTMVDAFGLYNPNQNFTIKTGDAIKTEAYSVASSGLADGVYTITAAHSGGLADRKFQIVKGSPTGTRYTSNFTLNFAKTGVGTVPSVFKFDHTDAVAYDYNDGSVDAATFKIGPYTSPIDGHIIIPLQNEHPVDYYGAGFVVKGDMGKFDNFDPSKVQVSITGKTEGTDYTYRVLDRGPGVNTRLSLDTNGKLNKVPAIVIEANPYILNSGTATVTHTLNITYNY